MAEAVLQTSQFHISPLPAENQLKALSRAAFPHLMDRHQYSSSVTTFLLPLTCMLLVVSVLTQIRLTELPDLATAPAALCCLEQSKSRFAPPQNEATVFAKVPLSLIMCSRVLGLSFMLAVSTSRQNLSRFAALRGTAGKFTTLARKRTDDHAAKSFLDCHL